jgi:hypothetical protein
MKTNKLWQLHNLYNKHTLTKITAIQDTGMWLDVMYCPCGRFYINHADNAIWDSATKSSRGTLVNAAILALKQPKITKHWQAYVAMVRKHMQTPQATAKDLDKN